VPQSSKPFVISLTFQSLQLTSNPIESRWKARSLESSSIPYLESHPDTDQEVLVHIQIG
jgi:hypothetical protein